MQWFKHDSNANTDDKLQNVLLDYGLEGYGLYWYCLELIVNRVDKDNITFELKHDARVIARNTGSTVQKVEEMMRRFVELGLFESDNGMITCLKILKRMDTSMTSNQFMREIIAKARENHDGIMMQSGNVMQEEKRIEENRIEKKIKPLRKSASTFTPPIDENLLNDYLQVRKAKRVGALTETAFNSIVKEACKAGISVEEAIRECCVRGWAGFKAEWHLKNNHQNEVRNKGHVMSEETFNNWLNGGTNGQLA